MNSCAVVLACSGIRGAGGSTAVALLVVGVGASVLCSFRVVP